MKKLIRIGLAVAAAVTGMLFALPALSASASPIPSGLQTFSRYFYSTSVPGGVNATLACPSGYRLVGSGAGHAQVLAETPVQNFTAVTVAAAVSDPAPNNFAYVSITCAPQTSSPTSGR